MGLRPCRRQHGCQQHSHCRATAVPGRQRQRLLPVAPKVAPGPPATRARMWPTRPAWTALLMASTPPGWRPRAATGARAAGPCWCVKARMSSLRLCGDAATLASTSGGRSASGLTAPHWAGALHPCTSILPRPSPTHTLRASRPARAPAPPTDARLQSCNLWLDGMAQLPACIVASSCRASFSSLHTDFACTNTCTTCMCSTMHPNATQVLKLLSAVTMSVACTHLFCDPRCRRGPSLVGHPCGEEARSWPVEGVAVAEYREDAPSHRVPVRGEMRPVGGVCYTRVRLPHALAGPRGARHTTQEKRSPSGSPRSRLLPVQTCRSTHPRPLPAPPLGTRNPRPPQMAHGLAAMRAHSSRPPRTLMLTAGAPFGSVLCTLSRNTLALLVRPRTLLSSSHHFWPNPAEAAPAAALAWPLRRWVPRPPPSRGIVVVARCDFCGPTDEGGPPRPGLRPVKGRAKQLVSRLPDSAAAAAMKQRTLNSFFAKTTVPNAAAGAAGDGAKPPAAKAEVKVGASGCMSRRRVHDPQQLVLRPLGLLQCVPAACLRSPAVPAGCGCG